MNALGAQDMGSQQGQDRIERHDAGADPIGQRRRVDLDALTRVSRALPVQRLMVQELGDQNHRQKARPGKAAWDRMRGRRRLADRFAIPAGELLAHLLDDLPPARLAFQRLGDYLAELRSLAPPHLPQAQGAGSTTRSTGRFLAACATRAANG